MTAPREMADQDFSFFATRGTRQETLTFTILQSQPLYGYNRMPSLLNPPIRFKRKRIDQCLKKSIAEGTLAKELHHLEMIGTRYLFKYQALDAMAIISMALGVLMLLVAVAAHSNGHYSVGVIGASLLGGGVLEYLTVSKYIVQRHTLPALHRHWEEEVRKWNDKFPQLEALLVVGEYLKSKDTRKGRQRIVKPQCRVVLRYPGVRGSRRNESVFNEDTLDVSENLIPPPPVYSPLTPPPPRIPPPPDSPQSVLKAPSMTSMEENQLIVPPPPPQTRRASRSPPPFRGAAAHRASTQHTAEHSRRKHPDPPARTRSQPLEHRYMDQSTWL